jgi:hypothetical protein
MIRALRQHFARRRLARMVAERAASFECQDYRRRRAAALKARRR